ncbi:MAG: hypothetical protein Hyperionvirus28_22 [Hyperionvirus sp.]|uniref:Uncharacterized protein n=1 Tax=Hyperionvirus sp. TaxID=2487770 RepID=A0A3G5AD45_9VIRU|nr:MAG: hypothetical protein Hyperionvirus28_22 [Hyperionvirus sp.]
MHNFMVGGDLRGENIFMSILSVACLIFIVGLVLLFIWGSTKNEAEKKESSLDKIGIGFVIAGGAILLISGIYGIIYAIRH